MAESISLVEARRLALAKAGLLAADRTGFPVRAGRSPRRACHEALRRLGYLQLDTIGVAGARSHALVLLSRIDGLAPDLPEALLQPGAPIFEYWGHEASWMPMELYPAFEFRRREYARRNPWWGDILDANRSLADRVMRRIHDEGPLRWSDFEDDTERSDWGFTLTKRVLRGLWWAGELAVVRRLRFQPEYDLTERVIPREARRETLDERAGVKRLLMQALAGHGWARTGTLTRTWRIRNRRELVRSCLEELREEGAVVECGLSGVAGWARPDDLDLAAGLSRLRPRRDRGVLLSPFDPLVWDRPRVKSLFGFEPVIEVFKPAHQRTYGYYCMPVLAGDRLVARCDVKAERDKGILRVLSVHDEDVSATTRAAVRHALSRHSRAVGLGLSFGSVPG